MYIKCLNSTRCVVLGTLGRSSDLGILRVTGVSGGVGSCRKCVLGQDKKVNDRALIFISVTREGGTSKKG